MQRIAASILLFIALSATAAQFKFDAQTLTVPDGFEVELIAAPPLIERPISMSFDEQGHLYITDSAGMAGDAPAMAKSTPHRVMRLEDTDGDGKFDKSVVFADKMGFPEGCLWRDGSLYVAAPPQIFKLTDTRGEGVAQKSEIWFDGKTVTHCGNDLHGPYLGRDGWMYWCKGAFAEQTYEREGKPAFVTRAAHIFRARLDGSGIEPVLTGGMDNPVGFTMLPNGERILSCTFLQNPAGGKRDGLIHAIYGGVYGKIHDVINNHKATGGVMPVLDHLGAAAPCGLTCYESKILGDDFQNNLFTCCFNLHKVVLSILVPDGATYTTQDSDFISSDSPDFHPTDVLEDADGSLIVCDTGGWYKICCPTSQLAKPDVLGAVYRVRRKDAPKIDDPRGLKIHWGKLQAAELAAHLDDPRLFVRRRAMAELSSHKADESAAALSKLLQTSQSAESRRGVVWTLSRIDAPSAREAVRAAFNSADASIVHAAIHAASVWRDKDAVERMMEIVTRGARGVETGRRDAGGTDEALPRAAAEALGHIGDKRAVPALFTAAGNLPETKVDATGAPENPSARILEHSIIY
ncbi:MAG TPA: PVC-type heme-binding CxxCH protein, partial [Planctomycetota bacterium]|nr:PVC-type heme-binding CxxCH protein [Planctomycetota bacterium]